MSGAYIQRECLSLWGGAHSFCSLWLHLKLVIAARFKVILHVLSCIGPMWVGAVKPGVLSSGCFLHYPNNDLFLQNTVLTREKTTSYMGPNLFQSTKNSVCPEVARPLLSFLDDRASSLAQTSSKTEGELFHSWKKQKYKQTTTCYIKLCEEKSILGKYQATYFMIFKCHSFVQYWVFYMEVEL